MNIAELSAIRNEIEAELSGKRFGKLFTLSRLRFAIDFRPSGSGFLFFSAEPSAPRVYLINRRLRDLEKQSVNPNSFTVVVQKGLAGKRLTAVEQVEGERVLNFAFSGQDDLGVERAFSLTAQLTGRSANLFLLDAGGRILESLREMKGAGQAVGELYKPPHAPMRDYAEKNSEAVSSARGETLSEALDRKYLAAEYDARLASLADAARAKIRRRARQLERLSAKLDADLAGRGDAVQWKKFGDLLLANAAAARREGATFIVLDYYDESTPEIVIPADENVSITEAAESYFKRYTKAKNAAAEIAKRRNELENELQRLQAAAESLEKSIAEGDETALELAAGDKKPEAKKARTRAAASSTFARKFTSSDKFEILVGKKAKDNDHLSFKVAKSLDLWMHAADYPGSHVVVRNPNRLEIPPTTVLEAAQLAAFYSQGRAQTRAAVHYTQKKFVNKPRAGAPGLVSLASFKTILVEPRIPELVRREEE